MHRLPVFLREMRRGMRKFLPEYKKVVFRAYTNGDFKHPVVIGELQEHLGIMGPFIRAEVHEQLTVSTVPNELLTVSTVQNELFTVSTFPNELLTVSTVQNELFTVSTVPNELLTVSTVSDEYSP